MTASRFLGLGAGGVVALVGGGYYAMHLGQFAKLESEVFSVKKLVDWETKALEGLAVSLTSQEMLLQTLATQEEEKKKELKSYGSKVEAARKHLVSMQAAYSKEQETALLVASDSLNAITTLDSLKAEFTRSREAVSTGEKALVLAKLKASESKKLLNPLNHPRVKALMGRK
eukprot:gene14308-20289_t